MHRRPHLRILSRAKLWGVLLSAALIAPGTFAPRALALSQQLAPEGAPVKTLQEEGLAIPIYARATLSDSYAKGVPLALTGAGIGQERVGFLWLKVYGIASYIESTRPVTGSTAAVKRAVKRAPVRVLQLTSLRDLTPAEIREMFEEALEVNHVDVSEPTYRNLLNQITFDVTAGSQVLCVGRVTPEGETISVSVGDMEVAGNGPHIARDFWSMWFGVPLDRKMAELQTELLGGR